LTIFDSDQAPSTLTKFNLSGEKKVLTRIFNAHTLSDGTLRFMCLATLLLQPDLPSTILIDEPELGLHPYAITFFAALLRSAATQTQVIVSTQSVPLVNQFGPDDIVVVDREDKQSTFTRHTKIDLETWLDEYGMGDLWEKTYLGAPIMSRVLISVEGQTEETFVREILIPIYLDMMYILHLYS